MLFHCVVTLSPGPSGPALVVTTCSTLPPALAPLTGGPLPAIPRLICTLCAWPCLWEAGALFRVRLLLKAGRSTGVADVWCAAHRQHRAPFRAKPFFQSAGKKMQDVEKNRRVNFCFFFKYVVRHYTVCSVHSVHDLPQGVHGGPYSVRYGERCVPHTVFRHPPSVLRPEVLGN